MTRHEALTALLAKVEAGDRPAFMDGFAASAFPPESAGGHCTFHDVVKAYHGSLDAAKALHEAVLPDFDAAIYLSGHAWVYVPTLNAPPVKEYRVENDCPARAWLIAILKALIAMEEVQ